MSANTTNTVAIHEHSRAASLQQLSKRQFDLLIIGGGITGAGIANEATQRGLSVALIEAKDFASGTSSRSSKLIHGGLRYLAMGEVNLVRETALERKAVHAMAPHLAEPCWMVVPARNRAAMLKFRTGIGTYEKLGAVANQDRHQNWDAEALAVHEPALRSEDFPHACAYREYLTDDARLVLGVLRSAVSLGAVVANRVRAVHQSIGQSGRIEGIVATDTLTNTAVTICAAHVVNAAGPWVEQVLNLSQTASNAPASARSTTDTPATDKSPSTESPSTKSPRYGASKESAADGDGAPTGSRPDDGEVALPLSANQVTSRIHLSKGVHIVVRADRLPAKNLVVLGTKDRRSIFVIPRGDVVYIGTTDTSYDGDSWLWPEISIEDLDYLLQPVAKYFKVDPLVPTDVLAAWAGLRPLVAQPGKQAKEISRKDEIWVAESGLITIAGGKLTGFRKMAESVVDRLSDATLASDTSLASGAAPASNTAQPRPNASSTGALDPIPGGDFSGDLDALAAELRSQFPAVSTASADRLVRLYGTEAGAVLSLGPSPLVGDDLPTTPVAELDSEQHVYLGEIRWAVQVEAAVSLEDVIYRRLRAAWYLPTQRTRLATQTAELMAPLLNWTPQQTQQELEAVTRRFGYELAAVATKPSAPTATNT